MTQDPSSDQGSNDPSGGASNDPSATDDTNPYSAAPAEQQGDAAAPRAEPYLGPQQPPPGPGSNYPPGPGSNYPPGPGSNYPPGPGSNYPPGPGSNYPPGPGSNYPGPMAQPGQPGYPMPTAALPLSESDARLWSTLAHVGLIVTGFVGPLIIWAVFKDRSQLVRENAAAATNFGFLVSIGYLVASVLAITLVLAILSPFLLIACGVLAVIFGILGALKANTGEVYPYPFNVTWLK